LAVCAVVPERGTQHQTPATCACTADPERRRTKARHCSWEEHALTNIGSLCSSSWGRHTTSDTGHVRLHSSVWERCTKIETNSSERCRCKLQLTGKLLRSVCNTGTSIHVEQQTDITLPLLPSNSVSLLSSSFYFLGPELLFFLNLILILFSIPLGSLWVPWLLAVVLSPCKQFHH